VGGQSLVMTTRTASGTAARVISLVGAVFALIEVVYILLILFSANAGNGFFRFIRSLAEPLALFFPGLFPIDNYNLGVIVNYGLAAVFWLIVAGILARLVGRW
jgi:hypothetical protein